MPAPGSSGELFAWWDLASNALWFYRVKLESSSIPDCTDICDRAHLFELIL
jgi:hypothetical protein